MEICSIVIIITLHKQWRFHVPSSSVERAKRGIVSRLWVLLMTRGLVLRSDWEELEEARGRRLCTDQQNKHRVSYAM